MRSQDHAVPCFAPISFLFADPAAGASDDWYMSEGSRFTYTPELRDNGFGFLLPPELIIPSGEEIWAAWEVMFNYLLNEQNEN